MTILERVSDFIEARSPAPVCDDCVVDYLKRAVRQHANHKTRELAKAFGFDRRLGLCQLCKRSKKVIGYT